MKIRMGILPVDGACREAQGPARQAGPTLTILSAGRKTDQTVCTITGGIVVDNPGMMEGLATLR